MAKKLLTPIKAIRAHCIGCSGGEKGEVRRCNMKNCTLYPYRMGRRPTKDELLDLGISDEENRS